MQTRVPGKRLEHLLNFDEPYRFDHAGATFQITLLPAGHIFGSSMAFIEAKNQSLLYTGDFKLRPGQSAEPCRPRRADLLIMETTYGRPQYVFPPAEAVLRGVSRFCREALDNDETPVLLGYSLGKSQELLCGLANEGLPLMLHGSVFKLTKIYEQFGQCFPAYESYAAGSARGKVLLCPPHVVNSRMMRDLGKTRSAILTGWAVDPNCRFRYRCDAAFPLSDHADFPDLIEFVKQVQPKRVYTLHGFAADFAQTLRNLGYDAQALSQDEQLALPLAADSKPRQKAPAPERRRPPVANPNDPDPSRLSHPFHEFALTCSRIAIVSSKLEKVRLLAVYLATLKGPAVAFAATWFAGRPFAANQNKVLQLGWAVLRDALSAAAEVAPTALHQTYLKYSDIGEAAFDILQARAVPATLSVEAVNAIFEELRVARGPLAKIPALTRALELAIPLEAKFLVKIITGDLRIGLKEGLVEDAVAQAFSKTPEAIRQAHLLLGDIGATAQLAAEDRLDQATLAPFRPIKLMLASPEPSAEDIWQRVQGNSDLLSVNTVWLEDKYDGIRCQLHKVGGRVALYSRDLKDITSTFFELVDSVGKAPDDFILDGEILAMRGDTVLAFAELQKRLGRRQDDLFMRDSVPIQYIAFDLLWLNGQSLLNRPLRDRREALTQLALPENVQLARITQAGSAAEIDAAFDAARARGNEGLMVKNPQSLYTPGRRGLAWLKLKKALATLDCVVVGAEYGHGKRNRVLSDYTFAVRDETTGELKTIGKAYTGLTDAEIAALTDHFLQAAVRQQGRYFEVTPDTVLEIAFDKIQKSDRHPSGLAMRFPRIVRIRNDKSVAEIDTLSTARRLVSEAKEPKRDA
jgi:DNA ligase-1